jgi:uncharacterized protein (TIGR03382 family)
MISFMNSNFDGNPSQPDLTQQPWFHLFEESFGRWAELSGVTYVYEPADDGAPHPSAGGELGARGDIRIGGYNIDGADNVLAFAHLPPSGSDMVFDTGDAANFTNNANNHRYLRNTIMHEIGHGFGLLHVTSSSSLLMAPAINAAFDGPQLDEVRGVQYFFGDANEEAGGGLGNDSAALASSLGTIATGSSHVVGAAANVPGQAISAAAMDFVSISNVDDVDFYSFAVTQPSLLDVTLTPRGGVFIQAGQGQIPTSFDANARNNLSLTVLASDGMTILAIANANPAGAVESLSDVTLPSPGTYYAQITGADDTIQLYELSLSIAAALPGDFNFDGVVDGADYVVWRKNETANISLPNDAGLTTQAARFDLWRGNFGAMAGGGAGNSDASTSVPEPAAVLLAAAGFSLGSWLVRRRRPVV